MLPSNPTTAADTAVPSSSASPLETSTDGVLNPNSNLSNNNNNSSTMQQQQQQQRQGVAPSSSQQHAGSRPQQQQQLRRATYVHVSDLTSAYNIDHVRLEQELQRVKRERENPAAASSNTASSGNKSGGDKEGMDAATARETQKKLQPPRGGYNLCLLVGSVQVVVDKFRVDGSRVRLAEVEVGDETGTVSLRARDDQIDLLSEISQRRGAVVLRNSTLEMYQGRHIRLAVTKWGKLTPYPDQVASTPPPPSRLNNDRFFSQIDLSAVASEMVVFSSNQNDSNNNYEKNRGGGGNNSNNNNQNTKSDYENVNPATGNHHMMNNNNQHQRGNRGNNRRGGGRGRSSPGNTGGMKQQQQQQQQHHHQHQPQAYPRYPAALHNYGYGSSTEMDAAQRQMQGTLYHHGGYHPHRQQPPQQYMLPHHQPPPPQQHYDPQHQYHLAAQHHQQQQQQRGGQPPQLFSQQADRFAVTAPGAMLTSGITESFETAGHYVPASSAANPAPGAYTPGLAPLPADSSTPHSPRMNPQAATFDPTGPHGPPGMYHMSHPSAGSSNPQGGPK